MLAKSFVVVPGGAGTACPHSAIAAAELHSRIFVPPHDDRMRPSGTRSASAFRSALFAATVSVRDRGSTHKRTVTECTHLPVNHAVAEKPRTTVPLARVQRSVLHWQ